MRTAARVTAWALVICLGSIGSTMASPRHGGSTHGAFQIRFGGYFPEGGGELWETNEEVFTLDSSDFNDFILGFSLVYPVNNNFEVGLNVDFYDETVVSEYRDFVDEVGFPILHDTQFSVVPLTVDFRFVPGGRYRMGSGRSRPVMKPVFYVGAGLGLNYWEYEEVGDFLDFEFDPPEIFRSRFKESGAAFETHFLAGVELPTGRRTNVLLEARYSMSDDDPGGDFAGLGQLELGGLATYVGASFRF